jgi:hypothetical protein
MSEQIKAIFEREIRSLSLDVLLPTRDIKSGDRAFGKYKMIQASISQVGLIEPIAVFPCRGRKGYYVILDGHLRLKALRELGYKETDCLISTEDDPFTYNDKVNRLSAIQEHRMIIKAIEQGVHESDIAKTLAIDIDQIRRSINLVEGIDSHVVEKLKNKPITGTAVRLFKRVKALRQHEFADLMNTTGDYSLAYAQALLLATPPEMLLEPTKPKAPKTMRSEDVAQLEKEMETLERDFRVYQETYGENALSLSVVQRYVQRLLANATIKRFLSKNYPEIFEELNIITSVETL